MRIERMLARGDCQRVDSRLTADASTTGLGFRLSRLDVRRQPADTCILLDRSSSRPAASSCGCSGSPVRRAFGAVAVRRARPRPPPLFEEIPPSVERHHLGARQRDVGRTATCPRRMGPGVRVLRLRQRRLDGHLHGQQRRRAISTRRRRRCKNALYKNNRDGTFTDVTEKAGVAGGTEFGMGCAIGDYDNDGYPDILVTAYGRCTLYHNNGNGTFTDVTDKAGRRRARLDDERRLVRLRQRRQARSVPLQLRRVLARRATSSAATTSWASASTASRASSSRRRACSSTTTATARSREVSAGTDIQRALGKALGVVATDINNDGLMDLFVANDTVQNFLFVNRGKGKWEEIGAGGGSRLQRQRHAALGHGRRRRRFRRRRLAGSVRRQRRSGDVLALPERRQRVLLRRRRTPTASRRRRAC